MFANKFLLMLSKSGFFIGFLIISSYAVANENFAKYQPTNTPFKNDLSKWEKIEFEGNTEYKNIGDCVSATSNASASGLTKEVRLPVNNNSVLRWAWTAEKELIQGKSAPEKSKAGDDFLALVYVIHEGRLPWQTKAINYVWSRENAVADHWPNPFLSNAHMLVVQSGKDGLGEWRYFERNIKNDFKKYFNLDIDKIDGIALMTDTDNTKGKATACYQLPLLMTDENIK